MTTRYLFTSESVSEGHPDKVADQISDAILDAYLNKDPHSRVAVETLITHNNVIVAGEVSSQYELKNELQVIVRRVIRDIGYNDLSLGFDYWDFHFQDLIHEQSRDIKKSISTGGAGDQGLMFGYACNETPEFMPLSISLAHKLVRRQAAIRKDGTLPWLGPDAKSQVTLVYADGRPIGVDKVILSTQHSSSVTKDDIEDQVIEHIICPVMPKSLFTNGIKFIVNPGGRFETGGPQADTGLTGRKIIVDTYGGACPHGGGAFSGKDATKVDRSGAYVSRYLAKNIVASGIAERCTIQLSYAIGVAEPTSLFLDFHNTGIVEEIRVQRVIEEIVDLTPTGIIERLSLYHPIYQSTSCYGHFGEAQKDKPWEKLDLVQQLQSVFNVKNKGGV